MRGNPGKYVQHTDGRHGIAYHKDQVVPGKVAVYMFEGTGQGELFVDRDPLAGIKNGTVKKILCSPENLKVIGFID